MTRYFLGVDGGQSSTTALIGDESGRVLAQGRGGPCNHVKGPEGREKFTRALHGCVNEACTGAGLEAGVSFEAACLGFSGGPADKDALIASELAIQKRFVTTDAVIALAGAMAGGAGIIVIAGTGSIAFGRDAAGRSARAGGWGFLFGDEGGGFDITRQALRAVLRHEEGWGPSTALRQALLNATGASNANDLLHRLYTTDWPRPRTAALSRLVDECAMAGDTVAIDILECAGQQLAGIAAAVRKQLFQNTEVARVAPIGGAWSSVTLREQFRGRIEATGLARVVQPAFGPAAGALIEAYRLAGLQVALSNVPAEKAP